MAKKIKGCVVFDGDGTIWRTIEKYNLPALKCAMIICRELGEFGLYYTTLVNRQSEIDKEMVAEYSFSKEKFPLSWVRVYREFCLQYGPSPQEQTEKRLFTEASKFWKSPFPMKKHAKMVLRKLKARGYYLALLTAGDPDVQELKIKETGVKDCFNEIKIVNLDKSEELKVLALRFGSDKVWMVGDSKKSDIFAAIKVEVHAFYIPGVNWGYENSGCDESSLYQQFVVELKEIKEILSYFP